MPTLNQLRKQVVSTSLFPPCELGEAVNRLGFVQADPIRAPARAQDLILRHRVQSYRAGELEHSYPKLGLEEGVLYAYGFLPKDLWRVIHPKPNKPLSDTQRDVLELIQQHGPMHPKEVESHLGAERVRNAWGGFSRSTKMALESLQHRGRLRVARRDNGIRVYEAAEAFEQPLSPMERFEEIILAALRTMGPATRKFLLGELSHFKYLMGTPTERRRCLDALIQAGRIRTDLVESVEYLSLDERPKGRRKANTVRILAPFDPIVRDRERFEQLWGWTYRFEAYTPKSKRKRGYYAMPVLWREHIVGWANATLRDNRLRVKFGYVSGRPQEADYREAAEREVARLAKFLENEGAEWEATI